MGTLERTAMAGTGVIVFLLLLLIDWGWPIPTKKDIVRKTEEQLNIRRQQDDSRPTDLLDVLMNITKPEGMDRKLKEETMMRTFEQGDDTASLELLSSMLEDLDKVAEKKQRKSKRSSDGWTCTDLAFIVQEYDFVIDILEKINNLIRDTLEDELGAEVREFVTESLGVYAQAEKQLRASKEPFLQYQTELGCASVSFKEIMPTERTPLTNITEYQLNGSSPTSSQPEHPSPGVTASTASAGITSGTTWTEVSTTKAITTTTTTPPPPTMTTEATNVSDIARTVVTLSIEYLTLLDEVDSDTFPKYEELENLLVLLDSLIETLNKISALGIGIERSADMDCRTEMSRKILLEEAEGFINNITGIIDSVGNTAVAAMDIFLPELRFYLVSVLPRIEPHKDRIDNNCERTTDTATTIPGLIEDTEKIPTTSPEVSTLSIPASSEGFPTVATSVGTTSTPASSEINAITSMSLELSSVTSPRTTSVSTQAPDTSATTLYLTETTSFDMWNIQSTINPKSISMAGDWGPDEFCPFGAYATGIELKVAPLCNRRCRTDDDIGVGATRLTCAHYLAPETPLAKVTSTESSAVRSGGGISLGYSWFPLQSCPSSSWIISARYLSEVFVTAESFSENGGGTTAAACPDGIICIAGGSTVNGNDPAGGLNMDVRCSDGTDLLGNSGISVEDKPGHYSLSDWERCPVGSAVCGIRTRTQNGFSDAISNLGQTEIVLHCCHLPTSAEEASIRSTSVQTGELTKPSFSPSEALASTGPDASTEAFSSLSSSSSPLDHPATSTLDLSESIDQIQSDVAKEVDLVRYRTDSKIRDLRRLMEETAQGYLYDALNDLVATLNNISGSEY